MARPPKNAPPPHADEVRALWLTDMTTPEIADRIGVSRQRVSRIARTIGLPPRAPGRRAANSE